MAAGDTGGPSTRRVRIDLGYDGSPFRGFARQPDQTTVQGTLEGALRRLTNQQALTTVAGRTDAGVHALGQVVHLDVDPSVPAGRRFLDLLARDPEAARRRLDTMVGDAIAIWRVATVPDAFDARFSATARRYRYELVDAPLMDPRRRRLVWHVGEPLRLRVMQQAARTLLGEHDFASLCRKADGKHTVRRLDRVSVARVAGRIRVSLEGPAFCHNQVRGIVGCLVAVGRGEHAPSWLADVLAARDRAAAAPVAPPHGLTLMGVSYGRRFPAAPPRFLERSPQS